MDEARACGCVVMMIVCVCELLCYQCQDMAEPSGQQWSGVSQHCLHTAD